MRLFVVRPATERPKAMDWKTVDNQCCEDSGVGIGSTLQR